MALELNPKIEIKKSPIEGKGIFATQQFNKGEEVWISKGGEPSTAKIYTDEEFKAFTDWCIANGKNWDAVALGSGKHRAAIADHENHPENYGNHSCDPNTEVQNEKRIALRDILPGEEITVDYVNFSSKDWSMDCNCGAASCRKTVTGIV